MSLGNTHTIYYTRLGMTLYWTCSHKQFLESPISEPVSSVPLYSSEFLITTIPLDEHLISDICSVPSLSPTGTVCTKENDVREKTKWHRQHPTRCRQTSSTRPVSGLCC